MREIDRQRGDLDRQRVVQQHEAAEQAGKAEQERATLVHQERMYAEKTKLYAEKTKRLVALVESLEKLRALGVEIDPKASQAKLTGVLLGALADALDDTPL